MSRTVRYRDHGKGFNTPEPAAGYDGSFTDDWYVGDRRRDIADAERKAERLTGSATANPGGHAGGRAAGMERSAREELEDVAAALERLVPGLSKAKRNEHAGDRRAGEARDTDARAGRIESVLRALDRLDRRVEDLSGRGEEDDNPPAARQKPLSRETRPHEGAPPRPADLPGFETREPMSARGHARGSEEKYGDDDVKPLLREISDKMDRLGGPQEEHLSCMRREIESLREAMISRDAQTDASGGRDFRRLASAVEGLKSERGDNRLVYALRNEIADLRASLNRSNVEGLLKSLESGYAHLVERLDGLSRNAVDPSLLDGIGERLSEVENAFRMMPRADQVETLDRHVHDIGQRLEVLAERSGGRNLEMLGQEVRALRGIVESMDVGDLVNGIGDRLGEVTRRLDDVDGYLAEQRRFSERLTSMENRMPDAVAVDRLQERLEEITAMLAEDRNREEPSKFDEVDARFDDIVGRLERIEHARAAKSYDAAFTLLEKRLAAIDGKIDALEMPDLKAGRDAVAPTFDADVLSRLEEGIQRLNERLDGDISADPSALGRIHEEIADLRRAVIEDRPGEDLEARIRELAEAVGQSGASGDDEALRNIEEKVARLSSIIDEAEKRVSGMGHAGAAQAGAGQASDTLVEGLRGDLKRLLSAADQTDQRYRQETGDIQRLLSTINERLAALEPAETFGRRLPGSKSADPEDDRPLEPGSGIPAARNLPRTLEDPRERKVPASPHEEARNRKADFIAAARRAAQAAAAEAAYEPQRSEPSDDGEEESGARKGWLKGRLSGIGRKKGEPASEAAEPRDERNTESRKKIRAEIAASMAALRADTESEKETAAAPDAPAAEDKPARAGAAPSPSRRRAILLAAAAVVIALGTLQVFRLVAPSGGEVAVNETPSPVVATTEAQEAAVETASVTLPQEAGEPAATSAAATPPAQSALAKQDGQAKTPQAEAKVPQDEGPAIAAAPKTGQKTPEARAPAAPPAAAPNGSDSLAFAPPSGLANAFGSSVPAIPPGRIEQRTARVSPAGEAEKEVAGSGALPDSIGPISLRQAAERGEPKALFEVAVRYSEGKGVSPDLAKAVKYYEEAAAGGLAPAQYRLGSLYEKGQGVEKNLETARLWYRRAADQGSAKATHNLAVLHAEGISGDPDFEVAADWFERAANYGVRDSQYNLGILYARGLGTEKNLTESYKWFALAAKQGDREAAKKRDEVANILTEVEMAEATLSVETWKPKPVDPAANEVAADPTWSAPKASVSEASLSEDPAEMVRSAQKMLATLGFDPGVADGQIGPRTRAAVSAFQKEAGLPVTGEIDGKLLRALLGRSI